MISPPKMLMESGVTGPINCPVKVTVCPSEIGVIVAVRSCPRYRSTGVLSATRVASYSCIANPQKREKLYPASVYSVAPVGLFCLGSVLAEIVLSLPSGAMQMFILLFHQRGSNACWTMLA